MWVLPDVNCSSTIPGFTNASLFLPKRSQGKLVSVSSLRYQQLHFRLLEFTTKQHHHHMETETFCSNADNIFQKSGFIHNCCYSQPLENVELSTMSMGLLTLVDAGSTVAEVVLIVLIVLVVHDLHKF